MKNLLLLALLAAGFMGCTTPGYKAEQKDWEMQPQFTAAPLSSEFVREPSSETGVDVNVLNTFGGRQTINISQCAGIASLVQSYGGWVLRIRNSDCANLIIYNSMGGVQSNSKLLGQGAGARYADISLPASSATTNYYKLELSSNSGKTRDIFYVAVRPALRTLVNGQAMQLPDCGGYVTFQVQNGQANIKFQNVQRCNTFDILADSGGSTLYPAKDMQPSSSFTLPKSVIGFGGNRVLLQIRSRGGYIEDKFYVKFLAN